MKKYDHRDIGYLYVLKDIKYKSNWIKVGKTINPTRRLTEYNSSFPEDRMFYSYVSEKIDNLSNAENEILELLKYRGYKFSNSRKEWLRGSRQQGSNHAIRSIVKAINEIEDKYFTLDEI